MRKIPIGVQLYSVREDCARDLRGTLEALARAGYTGVEFAGTHNRSAKDLRGMLDDLGLKCCGTHTGLDTLLGDQLDRTVEFNLELGNRYLVVPWLAPERRTTKADWLATAALFDEIGEEVALQGLLVGYHNHHDEFQSVNGGPNGMDLFFSTSRHAIMQLDTGNAMHGGADPLTYLRRYPGRAITVHLKEYAASDELALIGEGDMDWQSVFDVCETTGGTEWYIVEQESYKVPPVEAVKRCLEALHRMGK